MLCCLFDHERKDAVQLIHAWMRDYEVEPVGRFCLWQYLWSDEAIKSGKRLVSKIY